MVLYIYFSKTQSQNEIDLKELVILFDGKFAENELKEKLSEILPELTNSNLQEEIKSKYKKEIKEAKSMFKRINFTNITMKRPRTVAWMKSKYFLLVNENVSEYNNKTSEEIITMLHKQYCSNKIFENNEDTLEQEACILDSNETSINSELKTATKSAIDLVSDDEDEIDYG